MKRLIAGLFVFAWMALPVQADEIEDVLTGALEAYQAGDAKLAKEEVEYVLELLKEVQGNAMTDLLPKPLDGWSMEMTDDAMAMTMFGGAGVSAEYSKGGDRFTVLIANSPQLVGPLAAMFSNAAMLSSQGEIMRINRVKFVISDDQIQGVLDKRVLIQFEGDNIDAMRAHLETLDLEAIKNF